MTKVMPLRLFVTDKGSNEADPEDQEKIRKAIRSWHNRLHNGSIPRDLVTRLGRELYVNLAVWEKWVTEKDQMHHNSGPGRPRGK